MKLDTLTSIYSSLRQLIRYGVVGVLNNFLGYLIYLMITTLFLEPKLAITFLYPIGAITAYFGHSNYSFSSKRKDSNAPVRYVIAHLIGYGINLLMLYIFSDTLHFPHQAVQAMAIIVVAGVLFLMFKYFVFSPRFVCP